ncbi:UDP-glucose 4-epimerase GalE [Deinococcus sp. QL22]|uniref:UDP-glucose 4-epimerase GalE n=1 Tax=Deinococcus sp. QL22 TaxID=2939437 RepID=UPI002017C155|nr:UDP-glucose 4-epimerase GalE [Deinococcus sp. QL22]UQN09563.1 UDP-glucose 4-epimerase GalE [Deinococcus sp. QL22]
MMKILITGGAGYIGSTVVSALADAGYSPVIIDSLIQGQPEFVSLHPLYVGDMADPELLERLFSDHPDITVLMHFAALIDVEESMRLRSLYYTENLFKAATLTRWVLERGVKQIIFSSTAAVYEGGTGYSGLAEEAPVHPLSPYARSKLMFESVLCDMCIEAGASAVALRYFNPIGADPMMRSGPYKTDPSHILGKLTALAAKAGGEFVINGDDYPTRDGTPVRDYIHVWDLAQAHLAALSYVVRPTQSAGDLIIINVGSGVGVTVRECVDAFLDVTGLPINVRIGGRRAGDTAGAFADTSRAQTLLNWTPKLTLRQGIQDALTWQSLRTQQASSI